ncbi:uncharacterized protein LOC105202867 isoform X1 [Solenopsis invicta]|uniref:uncharacterized protein LOC105202867 isoform X1 n=1 Tax=Solenopsis invicta TaxID=13686 RepID=UPI000595E8FF|nr:uncharacterized protein LOC105202867 isoform X1 [Solenopsis invicta]
MTKSKLELHIIIFEDNEDLWIYKDVSKINIDVTSFNNLLEKLSIFPNQPFHFDILREGEGCVPKLIASTGSAVNTLEFTNMEGECLLFSKEEYPEEVRKKL